MYDDGWDWPLLLYFGLKELNLTEDEFWAMTPRKFYALLAASIEYKQMMLGENKKKGGKAPVGYIDQIEGW